MANTIFLLYHDIDSPDNPTQINDIATKETVVRIDEFKNHVKYLFEEGYLVLSVENYLKEIYKPVNHSQILNDTALSNQTLTNLSSKKIVMTFDDGHISNYQYALPILKKYGFTATFYIIANRIGHSDYLGKNEIKIFQENNMEIGSHGLTHTYLSQLDNSEVLREVIKSKELIESFTECPIYSFAYPGGHLNDNVVKSVQKAGYTSAVSCKIGRNNKKVNPFLYRRIEIRRGTSVNEFKQALSLPTIMFFKCVDMTRWLIKKSIGLNNYEKIRHDFYSLYPFKR